MYACNQFHLLFVRMSILIVSLYVLYFTKRIWIICTALIHTNKSPYLHWYKKSSCLLFCHFWNCDWFKNAKLIIQIKKAVSLIWIDNAVLWVSTDGYRCFYIVIYRTSGLLFICSIVPACWCRLSSNYLTVNIWFLVHVSFDSHLSLFQ